MSIIDIIIHIMDTVNDVVPTKKEVDDISPFTDGHYSGPGTVISFTTYDRWSDDHCNNDIIFNSDGNYVGTKSWVWFNDSDKDWLDKI